MSAAGTLVGGTFAFIAFGIISGIALYMAYRMHRFNKDEAQIGCVTIIVSWLCCWLMWIGTWLHQWHPIIKPTIMANLEHASSGGGGH